MAITNSGMTLYTNNDNQTWSGTDGADTYFKCIQGANSESWNVAKNATETGTLTLSANMGSAKYFTFWMASDLAFYYTDIKCELQSSTNNFRSFTCADSTDRDISGDFHPSVCQIALGTQTGTYDPASHTVTRIIVNNSSSGNIRAVINNWIDAMYYGTGRTINGTTATDKLFRESHDYDVSADRYDGCSDLYKGGLSFQTDVTVATTTGNSYGEVVTWAYARNTDNAYTLSITGTASFLNTNLIASGGSTIAFNSSSATSFSFVGGGISNGGSITFGSGQTLDGAVFSSCSSFTIPNTASNCTFSTSGAVTLTGSLTDCTISKTTAASAVLASTLNNITGCNFVSDGSSHAVDLGTISTTQGMDWGNTFSGYASTNGSTGSEVIKVNVASGQTLTINSSAGTPSVYNTGTGTVNVVSGQVTFTLTVKNTDGQVIQGAMAYVLAAAGGGLAEGTPIINKVATDSSGQVSDTRSLSANQPIIGKVRKSTTSPFYKTANVVGTINKDSGLDLTIQMIKDE